MLLGRPNQYLRHRKYRVAVIVNKWLWSGSRHWLIRFVLKFSGTNLKQKELWRRGMPPLPKINLAGTITGQYKSTKHQSQLRILFKIPLN